MILAVAALADGFASLSLEVDAGGVEEDQLEFGEQITPVGEQPLPRSGAIAPVPQISADSWLFSGLTWLESARSGALTT